MSNIYRYVEARLIEWADWYSGGGGIGHRKNILANLMELGGYYVRSTGPSEPPCNPRADEMEALVAEMSKQNRKIADALREQYLGQGTSRYKAKRLGVSHSQFRVYVDMGLNWLVGRLGGKAH